VAAALALGSAPAAAQAPGPRRPAPEATRAPGARARRPIAWPPGDAARGRAVFERFGCHSCHEVRGQPFPAPTDQAIGPELSAMGPLHDADYFVESIVNPSGAVEAGKGYRAADGSSKMPSYNESMTVQELLDLVAFLRSLRPPPGAPPPHHH
jgi:mono/diheme cytochrome c family protein